jgi:hypothetical protein
MAGTSARKFIHVRAEIPGRYASSPTTHLLFILSWNPEVSGNQYPKKMIADNRPRASRLQR